MGRAKNPMTVIKYNSIPPEPKPGSNEHKITFYDYKGDVISVQYTKTGEDAIVPDLPDYSRADHYHKDFPHPALVFSHFVGDYKNIADSIPITAMYKVIDGYTYMYFDFPSNPVSLQLRLSGSKVVFDIETSWGEIIRDVTPNTFTFNGVTGGRQWVRILPKPTATIDEMQWRFGNGATLTLFGDNTEITNGETNTSMRNSLVAVFSDYSTKGGGYGFWNCKNLKSVCFPNLNKTIGTNEFYGCSSLLHFAANITELISSQSVTGQMNVTLYLEHSIFANCKALKVVNLPLLEIIKSDGSGWLAYSNNHVLVRNNLFENCVSLEDVNISKLSEISSRGVTGTNASYAGNVFCENKIFANCVKLKTIKLPLLKKISVSGVSYASSGSVTNQTFANCKALERLDLRSLETIELGYNPGAINKQSLILTGCDNLKYLNLSSLKSVIMSQLAFATTDSISIKHIGFPNLESITYKFLPESRELEHINYGKLTSVLAGLHLNNLSLKTVVLGAETLSSIGTQAFQYCRSLQILIIKSKTVPTLAATTALQYTHPNLKICVDDAIVSNYKTTTNWIAYAAQIIPHSECPEEYKYLLEDETGGEPIYD